MRTYIIGNDGITLGREAPATVNEGEIAVASASGHAATSEYSLFRYRVRQRPGC